MVSPLEELPHGVRSLAVDVDLREERERRAVLIARNRLDLLGRSRLLRTELVARERQDLEPSGREPLVQQLQLLVVRGRQPSFGRHVHDERHFAAVFGERLRLATDEISGEIVEGGLSTGGGSRAGKGGHGHREQ